MASIIYEAVAWGPAMVCVWDTRVNLDGTLRGRVAQLPFPGMSSVVALGKTVQVDPIKPKLKPPGTKRLKLECDVLLSTSAFKFNLRRYTWGSRQTARG
jgi:hypothetical protein